MVGPSTTDEERRVANLQLKAGFVVLVAVSGALVAVQGEGTPAQVGGAALGGGVVGVLLVRFLARMGRQYQA